MTQQEYAVDEIVTQYKHMFSPQFVTSLFDDVFAATGSLDDAKEAVHMLAVIKRELILNAYEPRQLTV